MAIVYRMAPLTYAIGKRVVKVKHIGLVNIVAGEGVVREFIQEQATAEHLASEIHEILNNTHYAGSIKQGLARVREHLGAPGCSQRVAHMLMTLLSRQNAVR
jgi:lipid-A-disaccharide synthase